MRLLPALRTAHSHHTFHSGASAFLTLAVIVLFAANQCMAQTQVIEDQTQVAQARTQAVQESAQTAPSFATARVRSFPDLTFGEAAGSSIFSLSPGSFRPEPFNRGILGKEAKLVDPFAASPFASALPAEDRQASSATAAPAAKKAHHGLAITAAIVGSVVLVAGVGLFALEQSDCKTSNGVCGGARNAGIGMMAGGGAVAATGFYFWFRK